MSTPGDLEALFASISRTRASPAPTASNAPPSDGHFQQANRQSFNSQGFPSQAHPQNGFHQPSVSSPIYSPQPVNGTPPHHGSDVISPNVPTPRNDQQQQNFDQTANLLNLLKFSNPALSTPTMGRQDSEGGSPGLAPGSNLENTAGGMPKAHGRGISASDLVASFMGGKVPTAVPTTKSAASPEEESKGHTGESTTAAPATENAQDMLLRLLNRPKPSQTQSSESGTITTTKSPEVTSHLRSPELGPSGGDETASSTEQKHTPPSTAERRDSPMRLFGFNEKPDSTPFDPPKSATPVKETIFTYVNPFEQLAAASPRKGTPQQAKSRSASGMAGSATETVKGKRDRSEGLGGDANGRSSVSASPEPASKRPSIRHDENVTIPSGGPVADTAVVPEAKRETVSEALGGVAEKVDKQVEDALARAADEGQAQEPEAGSSEKKVLEELAHQLKETAAETKTKKGSGIEAKKEALNRTPPPPYEAEIAKEVTGDAADGGLAESWENVEEPPEKYEPERVVRVFNFPLKPFVSITLKGEAEATVFPRDDGVMDVARLKKEFDQLDRSLTSATSEYIVYALAKNGGMRIIRQDDGSDKQVFRAARDRIFNVSISTTAANSRGTQEQAVLGVGISGAVYWATISKPDNDLFERDALESESLIFPPFPASDENTSGGQLKTRARKSSCHPEFFAIGRGKSIHIVWPQFALSSKYGVTPSQRKVDTEKFFKDRLMKITTGKAGKDFIFSEDDTVIASLDKTGRIRFWDIREISNGSKVDTPMDIRIPLRTIVTGSPSEKSWPTSVLFIDKLRPYVKSIALRYILVGLKQNHTLQLWDIGLGKAVQELNLSHENESDPICSVAYHPGSGILVIGHPTRNCIYFVHLSAPRYSLPPMSQAVYIQRLADQDDRLPKPESTACMSGIRELSFASKGQLRSLELLPLTKSSGAQRTTEEENGLFELYVMHSRGVTCLNIRKDDLGWNKENKIANPLNALAEGKIEIKDLQDLPGQVSDTRSVSGETQSQATSKSVGKEAAKKTTETVLESSSVLESSRNHSPAKNSPKKKSGEVDPQDQSAANGVEKIDKDKKKKKKGGAGDNNNNTPSKSKDTSGNNNTKTPSVPSSIAGIDRRPTSSPQKVLSSTKDSTMAQPGWNTAGWTPAAEASRAPAPMAANQGLSTPPVSAPVETANLGISGEYLNKEMKKIEQGVSNEFSKILGRELGALYQNFNEDRRAQDATANAKQDAVLRLISSTLSDNVEKNLARIIMASMDSTVVPNILQITGATLDKRIGEIVTHQLSRLVPHEIRNVLPESIARAIQNPDVLKNISDLIGNKIALHVENEFSNILHNKVSPAFQNLAIRSAEKMRGDMERHMSEQIQQYEIQRHNDSVKIDQLTSLVRGLSDTVSSMAATQTSFQTEFLKLNRRLAAQTEETAAKVAAGKEASSSGSTPAPAPAPPKSAEDVELAEIDQLMRDGKFEDGSLKWLHSTQQADLFDNFFVKCNPAYLASLSPIVTLSIGVAVTASLETNVVQRLNWLETVLQAVDLRDPDILEVAPKIMDVLINRLEALYMSVAETTPHSPILRRIPPLTRRARDLRDFQ